MKWDADLEYEVSKKLQEIYKMPSLGQSLIIEVLDFMTFITTKVDTEEAHWAKIKEVRSGPNPGATFCNLDGDAVFVFAGKFIHLEVTVLEGLIDFEELGKDLPIDMKAVAAEFRLLEEMLTKQK